MGSKKVVRVVGEGDGIQQVGPENHVGGNGGGGGGYSRKPKKGVRMENQGTGGG